MKNEALTLVLFIGWVLTFGQGSSNGLSFDGVNDYIRLDNFTLVKSYSSHTIEMWVKSSSDETGAIYSEGYLSSNYRGQFRLSGNGSGKLNMYFIPASGPVLVNNIESTLTVFDGTWHHIALIGQGDQTVLYVDGFRDPTNFNYSRPTQMEANGTKFGAQAQCCTSAGQFSRPYSGEIDEIRLWSTARSSQQIRDFMCQKLTGNESSLVLYYPLNQISGNIVQNYASGQNQEGRTDHANLPGPYAQWVRSGAPVGDESVHDYSINLSTILNIAAATGDHLSVTMEDIGTGLQSIHVYRLDNPPDHAAPPNSMNKLSEINYYGVALFGGSGYEYTVRYNYEGHPGILDESTLQVAKRYNNADLSWIDASAVLDEVANTLTMTGNSSSEYILADNGRNTLPLDLLFFKVKSEWDEVILEWATLFDAFPEDFILERSRDGWHWEGLKANWIDRIKTINSPSRYFYFIDIPPFSGVVYYRLNYLNPNGRSDYSQIQRLFIHKTAPPYIHLYPNPVRDYLYVDGVADELLEVTVYNERGQKIQVNSIQSIHKANSIRLDFTALRPGRYIIRMKTQVYMVLKL